MNLFNRKTVLILFFIFLIQIQTIVANPYSAQKLIPANHWIYDSLTTLELESAITTFSDEAPLSIEQIKSFLNEIDYDSLSNSGKSQYDKITSYFKENEFSYGTFFSVGLAPVISLEGQYKTNADVDWVYNRYERDSFILLPVSLSAGDYVCLQADLPIGQNRTAMGRSDNYLNIPLSSNDFDINFPHNTYLSTGMKFSDDAGINFRMGMGSQSFGRTLLGSVILSEYLTDTPYASLSIYSKNVNYACSITELNKDRYMYSHKLEFRLFNKFTFNMYEAVLPYGSMDLRFFNPFTIFHGYAAWHEYESYNSNQGSFCGLKMVYTPCKFLRLYTHIAMNQFQTTSEMENYPDVLIPNAMGFQAGAKSSIPIATGHLHFTLEGYYTNPYFYINENPNWSYVRTYRENTDSSETFYEWIGSPLGPDTIACKLEAVYEDVNNWKVKFDYLFAARGELSNTKGSNSIFSNCGWGGYNFTVNNTDNWVYPTSSNKYKNANKWSCPTGTPEYVNCISLCASFFPVRFLELKLQPSYTFIFNFNHESNSYAQSFECAVACKLYIAKIK